MITISMSSISSVLSEALELLLNQGVDFDRQELQAEKTTSPLQVTRELAHVTLDMPIPEDAEELAIKAEATLPWAEAHFLERVGGEPLNPGEEYKNWPWYRGEEGSGVEKHKERGQFSHTYMERYWPRYAGDMPHRISPSGTRGQISGIRYEYGDLDNLVNLLATRPLTRQAYLPVWFPEDLHAADVERERVPCSLGYHFLVTPRDTMDVLYPIRSCDFVRHMRNDIYLTGRLLQWVCHQVEDMGGPAFTPGRLAMVVGSLHCFQGDLSMLKKARLGI